MVRDGFSIDLKEGKPNGNKVNGDIDLMFNVEDLEGVYRLLAGRAIIEPLREMPYGKEFYIEDPDGYVLAFLKAEKVFLFEKTNL
jgi:predicted enzyme related to lactoylglutathione lyase